MVFYKLFSKYSWICFTFIENCEIDLNKADGSDGEEEKKKADDVKHSLMVCIPEFVRLDNNKKIFSWS